MSEFLKRFDESCRACPDAVAFANSRNERLTYGQLRDLSGSLAAFLLETCPDDRPVVVYGHKSPYMLVSMLACVRSGRPFVPVDISFPSLRVNDIVEQVDAKIILDASQDGIVLDEAKLRRIIPLREIEELACAYDSSALDPSACVSGDDDFYIIFTSGSTGRPKGVRVGSDAVDAFMHYTFEYELPEGQQVSFNRAPFSFDVSYTDFIGGLARGYQLFALDEDTESELSLIVEELGKSGASVWVSTPSFVEMCLTSPEFGENLMPDLHSFILAGETLRNGVVRSLHERFPRARVVNAYGPTESTVVVSGAVMTPEMAASDEPLSVGYVKPGTEIRILDPDTLEELPAGESGEIYIYGDSVANGYFNRPDLTEAAFAPSTMRDGSPVTRYKTGDRGFMTEDGLLHHQGRYDFQIKLHGYRIELGEIESALCNLESVSNAVVIPFVKGEVISYLCACILLAPGVLAEYATTRALKAQLREKLPEYMIPRKFAYVEEYPVNQNGKVDRGKLSALHGRPKAE